MFSIAFCISNLLYKRISFSWNDILCEFFQCRYIKSKLCAYFAWNCFYLSLVFERYFLWMCIVWYVFNLWALKWLCHFILPSIVAIATQKSTLLVMPIFLWLFPWRVFIFIFAIHQFHNNMFMCGFQLILFSKSVFFFNYIRSSANIYIITSSQHFISFFWNSTGYMLTFSLGVLWPLTSVSYSLILLFPSSLPQWVPLEEPIQKPRSKETRLQFILLNVSGHRGKQRNWRGKEKHLARWDIAMSIWGYIVFWLKTLFMIPL